MKTFVEIKEICKDRYLLSILMNNLNLIKLVDENYSHIVELECLIKLLKGGLESYYKEYHPFQEDIIQFCAIVAENTRANHYRSKEGKFDDVYTILEAL